MLKMTVFKNLYDKKTSKFFEFKNFDSLVNFLKTLSDIPLDSKNDAILISSASFLENSTRLNKNVEKWSGWCCVDIDNITKEDFDIASYPFRCLRYSTASSTVDHPKFRLVVSLNRDVLINEIPHFWYALNKELGTVVDKQTKDPARMFYVPATYKNAFNFFDDFEGEPLNVDDLLKKHPYEFVDSNASFYDKLPDSLRESLNRYKTNKMNKMYKWSTYKDCPFVSKKMVNEYTAKAHLDGSGRYSQIYSIMVSIASRAFKMGYPINEQELVTLIKQLDADTSRRYQKRKLDVEAKNAIIFALRGQ